MLVLKRKFREWTFTLPNKLYRGEEEQPHISKEGVVENFCTFARSCLEHDRLATRCQSKQVHEDYGFASIVFDYNGQLLCRFFDS